MGMDKNKAKNILIELSKKSDNWERDCNKCPLNERFNKNISQKEIDTYLKEHNLHDISICSSRFLYSCLKYKPNKIENIIKYAKKITCESVFLDYEFGCPCGDLHTLSKYVLEANGILSVE